MIMSEKNLTPFDGVNMKEIEEGLTIADGERLGHFDITANGDYAASTQGMAGFSDVSVNVPNTYTAQDEGKVVNSGALVAQTAMAEEITENNTYDTTNYNSVTVNVAGSSVGFAKMAIGHAVIDVNDSPISISLLFINNDSSSVDVSELRAQTILILNPVDELKVRPLTSVGSNYSVTFVPTANCKVYENDTELDLNDIFQPRQTPVGPTTYDPNGIKAHFITGDNNPYTGVSRKLYDNEQSLDVTIE